MTLPNERTRAVIYVGEFLRRLSSPYVEGGIKRIPAAVRAEARALLRHYPFPTDLLYADDNFDKDEVTEFLTAREKKGIA